MAQKDTEKLYGWLKNIVAIIFIASTLIGAYSYIDTRAESAKIQAVAISEQKISEKDSHLRELLDMRFRNIEEKLDEIKRDINKK